LIRFLRDDRRLSERSAERFAGRMEIAMLADQCSMQAGGFDEAAVLAGWRRRGCVVPNLNANQRANHEYTRTMNSNGLEANRPNILPPIMEQGYLGLLFSG